MKDAYVVPIVFFMIGVVLLLLIGLSLAAGLIGLLLLLFGMLSAYAIADKCPTCHWPWTLKESSRSIVNQERGFGLVSRMEARRGYVGDVETGEIVERQERVPFVTSTIQISYICSHCSHSSSKQYVEKKEDFSAAASAPPTLIREVHREVRREVLRIPCPYCGTLVDPIRERKCPNCGARAGIETD